MQTQTTQTIVNNIHGFKIQATDGDVGKVDTLYFDERTWAIRYLVVNVGNWLLPDKILLSPESVTSVNHEDKTIFVALTREQVKNSPDIDMEKPVSRQHEVMLHDYYNWNPYWLGAPTYSGGLTAVNAVAVPQNAVAAETEVTLATEHVDSNEENAHLRSTQEVEGYYIHAVDGEIGHVDKFLVDTEFWFIRYFVVDTKNWLPGKKVIVSPNWLEDISWTEREVTLNLSREQVGDSPEYEGPTTVNRTYEQKLYDHYHQAVYWSQGQKAH